MIGCHPASENVNAACVGLKMHLGFPGRLAQVRLQKLAHVLLVVRVGQIDPGLSRDRTQVQRLFGLGQHAPDGEPFLPAERLANATGVAA